MLEHRTDLTSSVDKHTKARLFLSVHLPHTQQLNDENAATTSVNCSCSQQLFASEEEGATDESNQNGRPATSKPHRRSRVRRPRCKSAGVYIKKSPVYEIGACSVVTLDCPPEPKEGCRQRPKSSLSSYSTLLCSSLVPNSTAPAKNRPGGVKKPVLSKYDLCEEFEYFNAGRSSAGRPKTAPTCRSGGAAPRSHYPSSSNCSGLKVVSISNFQIDGKSFQGNKKQHRRCKSAVQRYLEFNLDSDIYKNSIKSSLVDTATSDQNRDQRNHSALHKLVEFDLDLDSKGQSSTDLADRDDDLELKQDRCQSAILRPVEFEPDSNGKDLNSTPVCRGNNNFVAKDAPRLDPRKRRCQSAYHRSVKFCVDNSSTAAKERFAAQVAAALCENSSVPLVTNALRNHVPHRTSHPFQSQTSTDKVVAVDSETSGICRLKSRFYELCSPYNLELLDNMTSLSSKKGPSPPKSSTPNKGKVAERPKSAATPPAARKKTPIAPPVHNNHKPASSQPQKIPSQSHRPAKSLEPTTSASRRSTTPLSTASADSTLNHQTNHSKPSTRSSWAASTASSRQKASVFSYGTYHGRRAMIPRPPSNFRIGSAPSSALGEEDDYNYDGGFFAMYRGKRPPDFVIHPEWVSESVRVTQVPLSQRDSIGPPASTEVMSTSMTTSRTSNDITTNCANDETGDTVTELTPRRVKFAGGEMMTSNPVWPRRCRSAPPNKHRNPITWQ